jgi:hypothetical protein
MSNNKRTLCTCFKCKKKAKNNVGLYVHPTTKWRHEKKNNRFVRLINLSNNKFYELNYFCFTLDIMIIYGMSLMTAHLEI